LFFKRRLGHPLSLIPVTHLTKVVEFNVPTCFQVFSWTSTSDRITFFFCSFDPFVFLFLLLPPSADDDPDDARDVHGCDDHQEYGALLFGSQTSQDHVFRKTVVAFP
jgi:hypothetical protein